MPESLPQNEIKSNDLYPYQKRLVHSIFERLGEIEKGTNLLFQLPTGGGKTLIFSEISRKSLKLKTWKPPESVKIGPGQFINLCRPPCALIISMPGRNIK